MSFIDELKRRNVFRVGIAYVVVSWLVIQVLEIVLDSFGAPEWVMKTFLTTLAAGLPFALIFAWAFELTPEGLKKERDVDRSKSITSQTGRKLDFTIIGILLIALAYFAYDKFVPGDLDVSPANEGVVQTETDSSEKSIAVLPFVNMSSDPEQEYFSDGISEEILNALAKVKELQVSGRTSSFAFKGQSQDLKQIGQTLGVDHILEGSVRKSGNTVRITAQLIRVDNGFHLWSETYDRELDNVFAIQDEISTNIIQQLRATLLEDDESIVTATRTNSEAYDLYLLAKQRMYERTGPTIEAAADLLDRAISIDPAYAPAYAQRGIATLLLSDNTGSYGDIPFKQAQAQGKLYLDKALELNGGLAEAWAGLGLYYIGQPTGAQQQQSIKVLRKALAANPGMIDAQNWLHIALSNVGEAAEAYQVLLSMIERDPLYRPGIISSVSAMIQFGEHERAVEFLQRVQPMIPDDAAVQSAQAIIYRSQGQLANAVNLFETVVDRHPADSVSRLRLSLQYMSTHQYERVIETDAAWLPIYALVHLGRSEEASILAFKRAEEQADLVTLFGFLNRTDRSDELIEYLEERWPNLEALRADFPPFGGWGDFLMLDVALAYARSGNQQLFEEAMAHAERAHLQLLQDGVTAGIFLMNEASRLSLAGEQDGSLEFLERAIDGGMVTSSKIVSEWPALEPLEGDPRFEAAQVRMMEHLNSERLKLGLEPVAI